MADFLRLGFLGAWIRQYGVAWTGVVMESVPFLGKRLSSSNGQFTRCCYFFIEPILSGKTLKGLKCCLQCLYSVKILVIWKETLVQQAVFLNISHFRLRYNYQTLNFYFFHVLLLAYSNIIHYSNLKMYINIDVFIISAAKSN